MKIKTIYLTGLALDWAVASARGFLQPMHNEPRPRVVVQSDEHQTWVLFNPRDYGHYGHESFDPSTNWGLAGTIIEEEEISINNQDGEWVADICPDGGGDHIEFCGPTPLVAAMRCYVFSKLGWKVDVPNELMRGIHVCACGCTEPPMKPIDHPAVYESCPDCGMV